MHKYFIRSANTSCENDGKPFEEKDLLQERKFKNAFRSFLQDIKIGVAHTIEVADVEGGSKIAFQDQYFIRVIKESDTFKKKKIRSSRESSWQEFKQDL